MLLAAVFQGPQLVDQPGPRIRCHVENLAEAASVLDRACRWWQVEAEVRWTSGRSSLMFPLELGEVVDPSKLIETIHREEGTGRWAEDLHRLVLRGVWPQLGEGEDDVLEVGSTASILLSTGDLERVGRSDLSLDVEGKLLGTGAAVRANQRLLLMMIEALQSIRQLRWLAPWLEGCQGFRVMSLEPPASDGTGPSYSPAVLRYLCYEEHATGALLLPVLAWERLGPVMQAAILFLVSQLRQPPPPGNPVLALGPAVLERWLGMLAARGFTVTES